MILKIFRNSFIYSLILHALILFIFLCKVLDSHHHVSIPIKITAVSLKVKDVKKKQKVKAETKPEVKTQSKQKPKTKPEVKTQSKQKPKTKPEVKTQSKQKPKTKPEVKTQSKQKPKTKPEVKTQSKQKPIDNYFVLAKLPEVSRDNKNNAKLLVELSELKQHSEAEDYVSEAVTFEQNFNFIYYARTIKNKIRRNWQQVAVSGKGIQCTIYFKINRIGEIIEAKIYKTSGSLIFDKSALEAVTKSNSFPSLPEEYNEKNLGVFFVFSV
ncbi:MAG: energy transducer TonB [bacterium]|nr:energy transducer TonB [bacterium]